MPAKAALPQVFLMYGLPLQVDNFQLYFRCLW